MIGCDLQPNGRGVIGCDYLQPITVQLPIDRLWFLQPNMIGIFGAAMRSEQDVAPPW